MKCHGSVTIPQVVTDYSDTIKLENYKVNTPAKFQVRSLTGGEEMMHGLSELVGVPKDRLAFVYFSAAHGAEPHTDQLNTKKFEDTTFVIPVILPKGRSVIYADGDEAEVRVGGVYEFDHTKTHSMTVEDTESGCVMIMVAIRKAG